MSQVCTYTKKGRLFISNSSYHILCNPCPYTTLGNYSIIPQHGIGGINIQLKTLLYIYIYNNKTFYELILLLAHCLLIIE